MSVTLWLLLDVTIDIRDSCVTKSGSVEGLSGFGLLAEESLEIVFIVCAGLIDSILVDESLEARADWGRPVRLDMF